MMTSFLEIVWPSRAFAAAKMISVIFGVSAALLLYRFGSPIGAVFVLFIMMMGLNSGDERAPSAAKPDVQRQTDPAVEDQPPEFPI